MPLYDVPLDEVDERALSSLVENEVGEDRRIEYKECLPGTSQDEKAEFVRDISSLANTLGGDVLYGVREKRDAEGHPTGIPEDLCGLAGLNVDAVKLRFDSMLRDRLDPRLSGVECRSVPVAGSRTVLVVRVPRSWRRPHMVRNEGWFYGRSSSRRFQLDAGQLREAFLESETVAERLRAFRNERLAMIEQHETPVPMPQASPKVVLHVVPLAAFSAGARVDLGAASEAPGKMRPIGSVGWDYRHNFDGFLSFDGADEAGLHGAYTQLFRNGALEAVGAQFTGTVEERPFIRSGMLERDLIQGLRDYLRLEQALGVSAPLVVMLSLLGVKGYTIYVDEFRYVTGRPEQHIIDRDRLVVPDVLVEDLGADPAQVLKPCLNAVWNACGYAGSLNYTEDGEWKPPR
jgi:hypothetical protein